MSFLRRLAANNPPRITIPNPAKPVLVSVVPVFARRCPSLEFDAFSIKAPLFPRETFVESSSLFPSLLLEPLATTNFSAGITTTLPSGYTIVVSPVAETVILASFSSGLALINASLTASFSASVKFVKSPT